MRVARRVAPFRKILVFQTSKLLISHHFYPPHSHPYPSQISTKSQYCLALRALHHCFWSCATRTAPLFNISNQPLHTTPTLFLLPPLPVPRPHHPRSNPPPPFITPTTNNVHLAHTHRPCSAPGGLSPQSGSHIAHFPRSGSHVIALGTRH